MHFKKKHIQWSDFSQRHHRPLSHSKLFSWFVNITTISDEPASSIISPCERSSTCLPSVNISHTIRGQSKKVPNFFFNLLLYLQLIQTCLLQSTPLYCWYTTLSVFFQFWNTSWNVFCGMARGSCSEFLLSPLPSEIGDLLGWTSTLGTGKRPQGPNLESRGAGAWQWSLASPKIHG